MFKKLMNFEKILAVKVVIILHWIIQIGLAVGALAFLAISKIEIGILVILIVYPIAALLYRLICETIIVKFKMAQDIIVIKNHLVGNDSTVKRNPLSNQINTEDI